MVYFCGADLAVLEKIRALLSTDYYHIQLTTDVMGVEGCVALKNAYAMGVSLAVGIADREVGELDAAAAEALCAPGAPDRNPVYNPQAALFAQSCLEMRRIVSLAGGDGALAGELPGAGDLYVTIFGGRHPPARYASRARHSVHGSAEDIERGHARGGCDHHARGAGFARPR